ncbi:MAG: peptidase S10 [Acetobacter sp.]|nr:peptidase S10 [Acetobacter sp.]
MTRTSSPSSIDVRPRRLLSALLASTFCATLSVSSVLAAETAKTAATATESAATPTFKGNAALLPADSITKHVATINGKKLPYTAHAGTLTLRDANGDPSARVFYVAYTLDGAATEKRPVTFFFNGGPGGATAYLNLGAAGPVALTFPDGNPTDGVAAKLGPNPDSWLPSTDMVFIDAVGTGYSQPTNPEKAGKEFYGTKQDGRAFAKAISLWIGQNNRHTSPLWLAGESYGGIRSIEVATALQQQQNILLHGIVMVSPALEMKFLDTSSNPLGSAMLLPSFAAAELERQHKLTPEAADAAWKYAFGPYLLATGGEPLTGDAAKAFYSKVATMTGLPESVVASQSGMPDPQAHDVRSRNGRLMTLYDATVTIADPYPDGVENGNSPDPTLFGFGRAYGGAFEGYAAQDLGFRTDLTYNLLNLDVNRQWDFRGEGEMIASEIPAMRQLLALNPSLRIFIANGYFDLACPFGSSRWVASRLPVGRDRVSLHVYPGGHMIYTRADSRAALSHDVQTFLTK